MTESFLENFDLQSKNSLAVPSRCRWFGTIAEKQRLPGAVIYARERQLPLYVLGAGTNVVLGESLDAVVVEMAIPGRTVLSRGASTALVEVGAGEDWHQFVSWCLEQKLYGLENLALIPGTCGAAPIQNIGAYGVELSDFLDSVEIFDLARQRFEWLSSDECELSYRDSIFKNDLQNRAVVVSMRLRLQVSPKPNLTYPALAEYMQSQNLESTPENLFEVVCAIRRSKLPDPAQIPNVGSFFKNPNISQAQADQLRNLFPDMPFYQTSEGKVKIPAAWLIDQCGWKGREFNGVGVHDKQALVLVNPGRRRTSEILELSNRIAASVASQLGIDLELEPRLIE